MIHPYTTGVVYLPDQLYWWWWWWWWWWRDNILKMFIWKGVVLLS